MKKILCIMLALAMMLSITAFAEESAGNVPPQGGPGTGSTPPDGFGGGTPPDGTPPDGFGGGTPPDGTLRTALPAVSEAERLPEEFLPLLSMLPPPK